MVQPWISKSYGKALGDYDVVVGCEVNADVGEDIRLYNQTCHVVARLDVTDTAMDTAIYADMHTVRLLMDAAKAQGHTFELTSDPDTVVSCIYIKAQEGYDPQKITNYINVYLRKLEAGTTKSMLTDIGDGLNAAAGTVRILVVAIWAILFLLLLAAFAMMIRERRREFAVLRVMGASRRMLSAMVLKEALLVSLCGGVAGILLAAAAAYPFAGLIENQLDLPYLTPDMATSLLLAGLALAAVLVAGPLSAAWTAHRLGRVDAGHALREEN